MTDSFSSHNSTEFQSQSDEDVTIVIHLIEQATPVARYSFKEELKMRLLKNVEQAQPSKQTRVFNMRGAKSAASVVLMLLITTTVVYALNSFINLQQTIQIDGGLPARGGQQLNLSKTVNSYTLTVEWIYADANRISVGISSRSIDDSNFVGEISPTSRVFLTDNVGNQYFFISAVGNTEREGMKSVVYSFAMLDSISTQQELSLNLIVDLELIDDAQQQIQVGTFEYLLQTQIFSERVSGFNVPQTILNAGIEITLKDIEITPSMTRIEICFKVQDAEFSDWIPVVELYVGNRNVNDGSIRIDGSPSNANDCQFINYYSNLMDIQGLWTVHIVQLIGTRPFTLPATPIYPIPPET